MLTVLAGSRAETVREVQGARALLLAAAGVANFRIGEETPLRRGSPGYQLRRTPARSSREVLFEPGHSRSRGHLPRMGQGTSR
jgi:hypothetical protein